MDKVREFSYKIDGLSEFSSQKVIDFETDLEGVKGVIFANIDIKEETVSYAIDQWASDYDVLCKLMEICEKFNLELVFDDENVEEVVESDDETNEQQDKFEEEAHGEENEEEVRKGKFTKGDVIEKISVFGISLILLIVGICINPTLQFQPWILMLSFTLACYETLYDAIIKLSDKKSIVEDVIVFVGSLIFMYLGYTSSSTVIMLLYGLTAFLRGYVIHRTVSVIENLENQLETAESEEEKAIASQKLDYLKSKDGEVDSKTSKIEVYKLKYYIVCFAIAVIISFIPPLFKIKSYGFELLNWLYVGASILVLCGLTDLTFSLYQTAKTAFKLAVENGVIINDYEKFISLSDSENVTFDKTGVLTEEKGEVVEVLGENKDEILKILLSVTQNSSYHVAKVIRNYVKDVATNNVDEISEIYGRGISCKLNGDEVIVGSKKFFKDNGIAVEEVSSEFSPVYVGVNGKHIGTVIIKYPIKNDGFGAIKECSEDLYLSIDLVSCDGVKSVTALKESLEINVATSSASSKLKAQKVNDKNSIYVGHAIFDKKTISKTNKNIVLCGNGDVSIPSGEIRKVPFIIKLAQRTASILKGNKSLAFISKIILLVGVVVLKIVLNLNAIWWVFILLTIANLALIFNGLRNQTEVI